MLHYVHGHSQHASASCPRGEHAHPLQAMPLGHLASVAYPETTQVMASILPVKCSICMHVRVDVCRLDRVARDDVLHEAVSPASPASPASRPSTEGAASGLLPTANRTLPWLLPGPEAPSIHRQLASSLLHLLPPPTHNQICPSPRPSMSHLPPALQTARISMQPRQASCRPCSPGCTATHGLPTPTSVQFQTLCRHGDMTGWFTS